MKLSRPAVSTAWEPGSIRASRRWRARLGARQIGLGVVEQNQRVYAFWHRLGFKVVGKHPPARQGNRDSVVIVMNRSL